MALRSLAMFLLLSGMVLSNADAASSLSLDSLTVDSGDSVAVNVRLKNSVSVRGVQFTLTVATPGVLDYLATEKTGPAAASDWTVAPVFRNDSLIVLLFSTGKVFLPADTSILMVRYSVRDGAYSQQIELRLSGVEVIGADRKQIPDFTVVNGILSVVGLEPLPGDANADGKSDIFDLLDVLGVLSGKKQSPFADVNRDGKVDVFDLLALLKIISNRS